MRYLAILISFLFHPIWFPIYGVITALSLLPIYAPLEEVKSVWFATVILSAVIPTGIYIGLFLKNWLKSAFLASPSQKKILLYGYTLLLITIVITAIPANNFPSLYFYILNTAISCFLLIFLHFFGINSSLYTALMGCYTGFLVVISIFYHIESIFFIAFCIFLSGIVASVRIFLTEIRLFDVFLSWIIGFLPQIFIFLI